MKTVPLIAVNVRRDAMTTLPNSVPQHEIAVLNAVHGKDNVYPSDEVVGSVELDPAAEGERLVAKYGEGPVHAAYGPGFDVRIAEAIASIDTTAKGRRPAVAA